MHFFVAYWFVSWEYVSQIFGSVDQKECQQSAKGLYLIRTVGLSIVVKNLRCTVQYNDTIDFFYGNRYVSQSISYFKEYLMIHDTIYDIMIQRYNGTYILNYFLLF